MKKKIINMCLNYIKKNTNYNEIRLKEIEYGIEGIYLTLTKFIFISLISIILGIFKEMILFTFIYNFLRLTSFGLHATKSSICLIATTILFISIPYLCIYVHLNIYIKILISSFNIIFMFKNSPADTHKRPIISKKRRNIYKFISSILVIIYSFISILIKNYFISNCLIFSCILQNFMISPIIYRLFGLPYNNYIDYLKNHPEFATR